MVPSMSDWALASLDCRSAREWAGGHDLESYFGSSVKD